MKIVQYSLGLTDRPRYTYEAEFFPRGVHPARIEAKLSAKRAVKLHGDFVAADPQRTLAAVQDVLERDGFFEMRLSPTDTRYLDGPEDVLTVVRCGVTTTLSTIPKGGEVGLDGAQAKAFFSLEDDLRNVIFSQSWTPPTPSPTNP